MNKRIASIVSPAIAGVVRERSARAAVAEVRNCLFDGADMIDLHMSCLDDRSQDSLRWIMGSSKLPVLALNYNLTYDWQDAGFSEEERIASLLQAIEAGAAGIDMQGYTFHLPSKDGFFGENRYSFTQDQPKEIVTDPVVIEKQCDLIEQVHGRGAEVLMSCHPGIAMKGEQLVELALFFEKRKPDIIKIVTVADTEEELAESFRSMLMLKREVKTPVSLHAGGTMGKLSRILNPVLGSHIAFCVDHYNEGSLFEQIHLKTARDIIDCMKTMR